MNSTARDSSNDSAQNNATLRAIRAGFFRVSVPLSSSSNAAVIKTVTVKMKFGSAATAEEGSPDMLIGIERMLYPSADALRNIQKLMAQMNPKVGGVKVDEIVDSRLIWRLDESGFIDALDDSKKR
jgi:hypothetical protein